MPYKTNAALPERVRRHLPPPAQTIYRNVFNSAWDRYRKTSPRYEEIAHRSAWAAVKRSYRKAGDMWVPITGHGPKLRTARAAAAP
jgi:cation transport regulator